MANQYRIVRLWGDWWGVERYTARDMDGVKDHIWATVKPSCTLREATAFYFSEVFGRELANYYEVTHGEELHETTRYFDDPDEATAYADEVGAEEVEEIGGSFDTLKKCEWCGEWYPEEEFKNGICERCGLAIWSRGEEW